MKWHDTPNWLLKRREGEVVGENERRKEGQRKPKWENLDNVRMWIIVILRFFLFPYFVYT